MYAITYINIFFLVSPDSNGKNVSPPVDPNQSTPVSVLSVATYVYIECTYRFMKCVICHVPSYVC